MLVAVGLVEVSRLIAGARGYDVQVADSTTPSSTADAEQTPSSGALTVPGTPVVLASSSLYEDDRALDVIAYVRTLGRYRLPALIVAAVVLVAGLVFAFTRAPSYTGDAVVLFAPQKVQSDAEATQQAAMLPFVTKSYVYMVSQPLVLQRVADKLGDPNQTVQSLKGSITTGNPANSFVLSISGKASSAEEAQKLTNLVADEFVAAVPSFSPGGEQNVSMTAKVVARAELPQEADPSVRLQFAAIAVVAALALGFGTAVALDVISRLRTKTARA
jgi:capsular polysaccharide biosynthesis protein